MAINLKTNSSNLQLCLAALYYYTIKASFFRKNFLFVHRSGSSIWLRLPAALCFIVFITSTPLLSHAGDEEEMLRLHNQAGKLGQQGRYAEAAVLEEQALAMAEKIFGPDHLNTAVVLNNLAGYYMALGSYSKAEPLYKRSLTIREKALGPEHPHTAISLHKLALLYGSRDRDREALSLFKRGLKADEQTIKNVFAIASEEQKLLFVKKVSWGYEGALSLIHKKFGSDTDALRTGLDLVLSRKGIVFDAQARQREAIANSLDPEVKELWDRLTSLRQGLAKLLLNKPKKLSSEAYRSSIKELNTKIESLESQLASMSGLVAEELEQSGATTEKVARRLPEDTALIEFVKIHDYNWKEGKWADTERYLAFILHPDQRIELIDLRDADKLDRDVQALLKQIKTIPEEIEDLSRDLKLAKAKIRPEYSRALREQITAAQGLYDLLWKPLAGAVGPVNPVRTGAPQTADRSQHRSNGVKSVVISPDGILNLVPFAALLDKKEGRFLTEGLTISYVTSGRDLLRGSAGIKPETDLFLAADPEFDMVAKAKKKSFFKGLFSSRKKKPESESREGGRFRSARFSAIFNPLPGTAEEARIIPGLVPGNSKKVVTGEEATEFAVLNVKHPKILHLATHGFFLKDQAQLFAGSDERGISITGQKSLPKGYENPLVRSGLAFAGANYAAEADTGMDGILTALEVSGMSLHGTDLVTLSACDTGVGEDNGRGRGSLDCEGRLPCPAHGT